MPYLCKRYPEYNLFTLKKLIPIEIDAALCEEGGIFNCTIIEAQCLRHELIHLCVLLFSVMCDVLHHKDAHFIH